MKRRKETIEYCLTLTNVYEDYPFDLETTTIRHSGKKKIFAIISDREGHTRISVKGIPEENYLLRNIYKSIIPGYHLNKENWNTIILDETVPDSIIKDMINNSYELTK